MRILLFGEYSNLHHTLCLALRRAGHEVLLVSDGDGWKNYPRDIDLKRHRPGPLGSLAYLWQLLKLLPRLRGYDVVQLINPVFLDVKPRWNRWVFRYLKANNRKMSVGCFGDDYYVISRMQDDRYLPYTDFFAAGHTIDHELNRRRIATWIQSPKAALTQDIMAQADCIIACLYEYWCVYNTPEFSGRLHYVGLPVKVAQSMHSLEQDVEPEGRPVRILFAAQRLRGQMKGTDQLEPLFDRLAAEYPDRIELHKVVSVPFAEYQRLVAASDVIVDQLYSFTPAMAALESLSQGKVVISGFEPAYRQFIGANEESGIINLRPFDTEHNYRILADTLTDSKKIALLKSFSQAFVQKYHDADQIAEEYVKIYQSLSDDSTGDSSSR